MLILEYWQPRATAAGATRSLAMWAAGTSAPPSPGQVGGNSPIDMRTVCTRVLT